jgi:hypothetical protein
MVGKSRKSCCPRISVTQASLLPLVILVMCVAPARSQGNDDQQSKQNQKQPCADRVTVSCGILNHKTCTPEGETVFNRVTVNDVAL